MRGDVMAAFDLWGSLLTLILIPFEQALSNDIIKCQHFTTPLEKVFHLYYSPSRSPNIHIHFFYGIKYIFIFAVPTAFD